MSQKQFTLSLLLLLLLLPLISGRHVINFRSPSLYPESLSWDAAAQHFVVGSLRRPTLLSVSDAAVTSSLLLDSSLPPNSSTVGVTVDLRHHRLLATILSRSRSPPSSALAAYRLKPPHDRLFLAPIESGSASPSSPPIANDVAVDSFGNAYVTDSANDVIWKVSPDGTPSILSKSTIFSSHPVEKNKFYSDCGLNGVVFNPKGYLLVVQSNTGKMFKVNVDDGTARTVILNKDLTGADGIAIRRDGVVVVVSREKVYFVKSDDSWGEGVVFDETVLEGERFATSVAVGAEDRVYVLYGHADEGVSGKGEREEFSIVEIGSEKESKDDAVWIYVLVGFGFAYFCFWRFQMRHLYANMNKKTA